MCARTPEAYRQLIMTLKKILLRISGCMHQINKYVCVCACVCVRVHVRWYNRYTSQESLLLIGPTSISALSTWFINGTFQNIHLPEYSALARCISTGHCDWAMLFSIQTRGKIARTLIFHRNRTHARTKAARHASYCLTRIRWNGWVDQYQPMHTDSVDKEEYEDPADEVRVCRSRREEKGLDRTRCYFSMKHPSLNLI